MRRLGLFAALIVATALLVAAIVQWPWLILYGSAGITVVVGLLAALRKLPPWRAVFYIILIAALAFGIGTIMLFRDGAFGPPDSLVSAATALGMVASFLTILGLLLALAVYVENRGQESSERSEG